MTVVCVEVKKKMIGMVLSVIEFRSIIDFFMFPVELNEGTQAYAEGLVPSEIIFLYLFQILCYITTE